MSIRPRPDEQADHGVGLDAQQARVRAYADLYGLELADVIVDAGLSAKRVPRRSPRLASAP